MSASAPPPARDRVADDGRGRAGGRRQRALTALGAAISLAALGGVVFWALHQEPPSLPDSPSQLAALAAAIVLYLGGCAARGERWQELLEHNGVDARRADTYSLVAVGYLGNNVLPARAGDALRVFFLTPRVRTDARTVIGTIVAERLLDVVLLVGLFVVLAYGVLGGIDVPSAGASSFAALDRGGAHRAARRRPRSSCTAAGGCAARSTSSRRWARRRGACAAATASRCSRGRRSSGAWSGGRGG